MMREQQLRMLRNNYSRPMYIQRRISISTLHEQFVTSFEKGGLEFLTLQYGALILRNDCKRSEWDVTVHVVAVLVGMIPFPVISLLSSLLHALLQCSWLICVYNNICAAYRASQLNDSVTRPSKHVLGAFTESWQPRIT